VQVDNRVVATVAIKPPGVTRLDDGA
jgi:hypothetical protein